MGLFSDKKALSNAEVKGGDSGDYFGAGTTIARIETVKATKTRKVGMAFIAECVVVESNNPKFPPGTRAKFFQGTNVEWAPQTIKEFLVAASGLDARSPADAKKIASEDWDAISEVAVDETQPLNGKLIRVEGAYRLKKGRTRNEGRTEEED